MDKVSVVIPSIREASLKKFLEIWRFPKNWEIIVVEDNPHKTFELPKEVKHYCWENIDKDLGENSWIISRRNAGIRCYGFLKAKGDYIITLDDDCYPAEGFDNNIQNHIINLNFNYNIKSWELLTEKPTRGFPYFNVEKEVKAVISHGLWLSNPDFDAIQTLVGNKDVELEQKMVCKGFYYSMCSMNLAFKKEIMSIMYFPLMGQGQPFDRFDDIWAGILSKKVLDYFDMYVYSGKPYINHIRESNPFVNLIKETPGIVVNEWFWKVVDKVRLQGKSLKECYKYLANNMDFEPYVKNDKEREYFNKLKKAMIIWVFLCQRFQSL